MRLTLAPAVFFAALAAGAAFAQDMPEPGAGEPQPPAQDKPPADRRADRRQREIERALQQLVQRLGLDETQAAKVEELVRASAEQAAQLRDDADRRNQAMEAERDAKIAALLTPAQAETYRQVQAERDDRRTRAQRGRPDADGRGGFLGRVLGGDPGRLAEALGLSEEQRTQVQAAMREVLADAREQLTAARGQGAEGMAQAAAALRARVQERIGGLLTEEQRAKLTGLLAARGEPGARGAPGDRTGGEGRGRRPGTTPAERADRRIEGVMRDLALSEDERLVLESRIRDVLTLDADAGAAAEKERQALEALVRAEGEADGTALRASMDALRQAREANQKRREALETELRELVTLKQEAVLVLHRVLR